MFQMIFNTRATLKNDILSGLTVALALVPEAVAFSFVAGVEPLVGLYAAFFIGLISAILGGRPGMISGATGALAVVIVALVATHGIEYLFAAVVLMGMFEILAGIFKLGRFVRLIPYPVMLGFVNGLAIVIFLAQLNQFKTLDPNGQLVWMTGSPLYLMLGLIALTMTIIYVMPKITKAIPAPLAAILVVTGLAYFLNLNVKTVADMASVQGGFPQFHIPNVPLDWQTLNIIFPYALILAAVGLIESLMTLQLVDEITETRGHANRECIGQGIANVVTGFFGGMGGCAMIGQSMINVNSGGRGRMSGISAALFLLFFIMVGSAFIEIIPLAALVGVMFMVVIGTFEWTSLKILGKIPQSDAFVILLVSTVTVFTDLAVAVASGVIVSALVFVWKKSTRIQAETYLDDKGDKHYQIKGSVFFGSVQSFQDLFHSKNDPQTIYIDFENSRVCDHSSLEAINTIVTKYRQQNKNVIVKNLSPSCQSVIQKAGNLFSAEIEKAA